jgi:hypothetical protein
MPVLGSATGSLDRRPISGPSRNERFRTIPAVGGPQIDKGREEGMIVPTIARIVRKPTTGFGHLQEAGRRRDGSRGRG